MDFFLEPFDYEFMRRALLACLLVGFVNGYLGTFVILRRLALIADALSHSLLPGMALATILFGLTPGGLFFGGILAASLVAIGGTLISRSSRIKDETAIAALFILAFATGIILIKFSGVRISLDHFLFGNILGVTNSDLWVSFAVTAVVLLTLVALERPLVITLFEPNVAKTLGIRVGLLQVVLVGLVVLAMLSSLQAVGVLLSLGLLILPAATMYLLTNRIGVMAWGGAILGTVCAAAGLLLSFYSEIPSGPLIVLLLGFIFLAVYLFSPTYGIVVLAFHKRHLHEESLDRWHSSPQKHQHKKPTPTHPSDPSPPNT